MSKLVSMSPKQVLDHLNDSHLVYDKSAYGLCSRQLSPGKGYVAKLMMKYRDASREREFGSARNVPAVCAVMPWSEQRVYEAIVKQARSEMDHNAKEPMRDAELRATLMMIAHPKSQVIFNDPNILREPAIQMAIATRNGLHGTDLKGAFDRIKNGSVVPDVVFTDEDLKKVVISNRNDLRTRPSVQESPVMHDSWRRHLQLQAKRKQNAASMNL